MTDLQRLHDVMAYICRNYPYPDDLSKARLTKLVYLADWRMSLSADRQITDIDWLFNHYGPYVRAVEAVATSSSDFEIESDYNAFGSLKETIRAVGDPRWVSLREDELAAIDWVIEKTRHMNFTEFLSLVYSTYPVIESERYDRMDLPKLARAYKEAGTGPSKGDL